ncbi:DgyrCDS14969 [Dimorphilus gyrociliatus]|uniref:DgyrCDS14969 n=1 Tax=Dimorphilus gyrociliatus TaxID=2664684 RepID=A0A7I8WFJ1_9ANNE|nr:DgyrCDS14969 [Dimorphilus gyrociliatus]
MKAIPFLVVIFNATVCYTLQINRRIINVASVENGATCQASSVHPPLSTVDYTCQNALEPQWINVCDWSAHCSGLACTEHWIKINFKKVYELIGISLSQRTVVDEHKIKSVEISFNNSTYKPVYQVDTVGNCLLLEEIGLQASSISLRPVPPYSLLSNIGFNEIFAYAYEQVSSAKDDNEEEFINIADSALGATCVSNTSKENYPCDNALNRLMPIDFILKCGANQSPVTSCVGKYIEITFAFPAVPQIICYKNKRQIQSLIKAVSLLWSSGFADELNNLAQDNMYHCLTYKHLKIESSLKVTIADVYGNNDVGFNHFKVCTKKTEENILWIQGTNYTFYSLQDIYHGKYNLQSIKFKVKETSEPFVDIVTFGLSQSLIQCNEWSIFWLDINDNEINYGKGETYGKDILATIQTTLQK